MSRMPKPQEIYKHFKGNLYQIITIADHSETGEKMVVYQALYGTFKVYVRPLDLFVSKVDKVKYPDIAQEYRFELLAQTEDEIGEEIKSVEEMEISETGNAFAETEGFEEQVSAGEGEAGEEVALDPLVWEFLDADSHEQRLNILASLHHRITDSMITTMAIACDIEVPEGDLEDRYSQLKNCLKMLDRFEIRRN